MIPGSHTIWFLATANQCQVDTHSLAFTRLYMCIIIQTNPNGSIVTMSATVNCCSMYRLVSISPVNRTLSLNCFLLIFSKTLLIVSFLLKKKLERIGVVCKLGKRTSPNCASHSGTVLEPTNKCLSLSCL
uniref:Uncharacterized protein n=1 Tax=Oryza brachyantha TaxID=4533 RepID=J3KUC2_ORYBR